MTVHAAKGLQFPIVAVPDLGRRLNAGHSHEDLVIGPPPEPGTELRFGMRLVFPSTASLGLWELVDLNTAESEAEAEEGCRLVYVAASRARDRLLLSGIFKPSDLQPADELKPNDSPICRLLPALAVRGWRGGDGEIALPGPLTVGGETRLPDAELAIRVSEPSPQRATELARRHRPPEELDPLGVATEAPPLLDPRAGAVPVGHLSYSALALYERCGYRFYVERLLGARESLASPSAESNADETELEDELPQPGPSRALALGIGNAVHAALEWSARRGWEPPDDRLLALLVRREGLAGDAEAVERVERFVRGWLDSAPRAELGTESVRPEVPFVLGLRPTVIRGQIDLLVADEDAGLPTVIDYKTDALDGRDPSELADRYRAQREVYALAVAAAGSAGARAMHVFLEAPDDPVVELFDEAGLDRARARLEAIVARMHEGSFEVAAEPYPALCFGCPAAARLCPRPAWRPSG
jgi:ATP-dependent helicase/nuclease subunit A